MNKFTSFLRDFIEDDSGLTAVEYAVAGAAIVGVVVLAFAKIGQGVTLSAAETCKQANNGVACP